MRDKLLQMAGQCEHAEGGPGQVERELVIQAYGLIFPHELMLTEEEKGDDKTRYERTMHRVRFTRYINADYDRASLDAAMMLVPEGLFPTMDFVAIRCWLRDANGYDVGHRVGVAYGCGVTMPLALTAAALRAHAAKETIDV